ncbi:MAG: hypothetical protein ACJZ44_01610 [Nitrospinales bacterium]
MKKDTSNHSLPPTIQEALSKAESTFDKIANRYDSVSQDIKSTEKLLGEKDVKSTFVFNFHRIEDMCEEGYPNCKGWEPEEDGYQTLDWRKDPKSNRYRLMVSNYRVEIERYEDSDEPHGFGEKGEVYLDSTKPLMEYPIEVRLYYHPRLSQFITTFADAIEEHLIESGSETLDTWYSLIYKYEDDEKSGEKRIVGRIPRFSHILRLSELKLPDEAGSEADS